MMDGRLPAKAGYDEVVLEYAHTYRNIETCLTFYEEIQRMPRETEGDKKMIRDNMIALVKQYCMDSIYGGFMDDCKGEMLHYSLNDNKQKDMENIMLVIDAKESSGDTIYWRDSSRVMYEEYTPDEFRKLYTNVKIFKTINKLYSDGLEQTILAAYDEGDVDKMLECVWGYELDEAIRAEVDKQVTTIEDISAEALAEFKEKREITI